MSDFNLTSPLPVVSCLIVNQSKQLLLLQRAYPPGKGQWALPAGYVEPGESAEEAICREVKEETGLEVEVNYYTSWGRSLPESRSILGLCFLANRIKGMVRIDHESIAFQWVSFENNTLKNIDWAFASHYEAAISLEKCHPTAGRNCVGHWDA